MTTLALFILKCYNVSVQPYQDAAVNLERFGLSPHEAAVYLAVLKNGEASGGIVIEEVKLHREQVYRTLKQLVEKGYLAYFVKHKRGYYSPVDSNIFVTQAKSNLEQAKSLQTNLRKLQQQKPNLIQVSEGREALGSLLDDIVESVPRNGEYQVLGGAGQLFYDLAADYFPLFVKRINRKKIRCRMTTYQGENFSESDRVVQNVEIRLLPHAFRVPASTLIYGTNKVAILIMNPDNVSVITIQNNEVAAAYRQNFEVMWEMGETRQHNVI